MFLVIWLMMIRESDINEKDPCYSDPPNEHEQRKFNDVCWKKKKDVCIVAVETIW